MANVPEWLVQVLSIVALLAVFILALLVLAQAMRNQETRRSVIPQFLLAQVLLTGAGAGVLWHYLGPPKHLGGFLMGSFFIGMLLNLPGAVVVRIVQAVLGAGRKPPATDVATRVAGDERSGGQPNGARTKSEGRQP